MRSYATPVLAFASVLALSFPAFAQNTHPHNPPALPSTSPSSRPVAPRATTLTPLAEGVSNSLNTSSWILIGPASLNSGGGLVSGRVAGIAVDPTNSSTIYEAAAGGGVWKTTNGGTTWTPLTDTQVTLAMGAIAIAPTNHLRIYAGTGEANNSADSNHGEGILVSIDGGSHWTLETAGGAFAGVTIGQIAVDPTNEDVAYAAVGGYPQNGNFYVHTGIWKTTDGGTTWTNMTAAAGLDTAEAWSSVLVDPTTPNVIYAALGDAFNPYNDNAIYRSTDNGSTWSVLTNAPRGATNTSVGRIALAVSPAANTSGQHVLYVAVESQSTYGLLYFERSDNADAATPTFTNLTSGTPNFLGGQGWYDIAVNVDTTGKVYCAGVENYSAGGADLIIASSNLGVTWTDISKVGAFEPHTDSHAIAFDSSNRVLLGSDGGVFRYDPTVPSWTALNGNLNTIQFTGIGLHPTSTSIVVGGSQDNGTELYNDSLLWNEVDGGDGGFSQIGVNDSTRCYSIHPIESFGSSAFFRRSTDTCSSWANATTGLSLGSNINFYPFFVVDPTSADHVLLGTEYLNETINGGTSWTAIGRPGVNGFNPSGFAIDSIALSPANAPNPAVIYVALGGFFASSSQIFVTSNDGAAWTEHDLPACTTNGNISIGCRVSQIVTDPNDLTGQTAFAVTSNYTGGGRHVYRTTNEGAAWTDITANLPDKPTWSVQVDTDGSKSVYVSTESGVYWATSPYSSWALYGTALPNAQGVDLELNRSLHVLAVATHGRGAWEILTPTAPHLTSPAPGSTLPSTGATFTWAAGSATTFQFRLGTTLGSNNIYGSGQTTKTSETVSSLPTTGKIYARLYYLVSGVWKYVDYVYATPTAMISPTPGSTFTGSTVTFTWNPGNATAFKLQLGIVAGGNGIYGSGQTTKTSVTVNNLPTNGETIHARLNYLVGGTWFYNDYTYKAQ